MTENQSDGYRPFANRSGSGRIVSSTEAKAEMGRTTFQRVTKDHVGNNNHRGTEQDAGRNIDKQQGRRPPTAGEMRDVFSANSRDHRAMKASGMSDEDIFNILKNR